jgi:SAM-dependent methyltransferase
MITAEPKPRIKPQECPFCGQLQDVMVNGHYPNPTTEDPEQVMIDPCLGYSFCNCKNIFFTDWKNMTQAIYDAKYVKRYDGDYVNKILRQYVSHYWKYLEKFVGERLLDIGAINDGIMDEALDRGINPCGFDIVDRKSKHRLIVGDFEGSIDPSWGSFSVITASHVFEHFKKPLNAIANCHRLLKPGGRLFVAMPDPYFIDWKNPYAWGHWHIKEHHIMFDMDSFAKELEAFGFKILIKRHNVSSEFICTGDFHIIAEKI